VNSDAKFWDKLARRYAARPLDDPEGYRKTLDRTLSYLSPTDQVLELGCGTASTALEIAPHVGHVSATDFSPTMIEIGAERLAQSGLSNVALQVADAAEPLADPDTPADAVLAFNLLHLVEDQRATLDAIHGMLKPGGLLISKTACLREKWYLGPLVRGLQWLGKAPHVLIHDQATLRANHAAAGFEIVEETLQPGAAPRLFVVARRL